MRASDDYSIVPPDPAGTIESLSALGYSLESAVADIVDNSIDAGADHIDVNFYWAGSHSHVAVVDNGAGMDRWQLQDAMALARRGPQTVRPDSELGRFGVGLKTASFSQCSRLIVWSRTEASSPATRMWDLDEVIRSGEWRLMQTLQEGDHRDLERYTSDAVVKSSGTVVLWSDLRSLVEAGSAVEDEEARRHFHEAIERVEWHLGMTFGRFIRSAASRRKGVRLLVNGRPVESWDPFLTSHESTWAQPIQHLELDGARVIVRPYVLPPKRFLTDKEFERGGGPKGWLEQQGFYLYRNDRLIVAGGWLGLRRFRQDEKHLLARITLDVPSALDKQWSIDVKKATARPPIQLRGSLGRAAKATRENARRVLSSGSKATAIQHADELSFVWKPEKKNGELRLRINWTHPLVKDAVQSATEGAPKVKSLLRLLEETAPIGALRVMFDPETDVEHQPFSDAPEEVLDIARRMYEAYLSRGLSPIQARQRLTHTPPFNEFSDLPELLGI